MTNYYMTPVSAIFQYFNDVGVILAGGKIYTYSAGTTTPIATYTDATGGTPNSNPIILGSNGRLNNVQIWQPQGSSIKVAVKDANDNQLGPVFDQIGGINDPSITLGYLANPASGFGADLVANAVRSYDVFSSVRSAPAPTILSGQTRVIDVEGASSATDNGGGLFYWNAASTDADDGQNVIKPNSVSGAGRYLRQKQSGFAGTISVGFGGFTNANLAATASYYVDGNIVLMRVPQQSGTSNSTSFTLNMTLTGAATALSPTQAQFATISALRDNGTAIYNQIAAVNPATLGVMAIQLYKNGNSTGWTNSGTKGTSDGSGGQFSILLTWLLN